MKCKRCKNDDWRVLEFDHKDPKSKIGNLGDAIRMGWGKQKILTEINKCDVLCANCHRIKTLKLRR